MGKYRKFLIMVLAAGLVTALMASGILDHADLAVSDRFYQRRSASDGEIVLVGIDQKALEDIGPYRTSTGLCPHKGGICFISCC